MRLVSYSISCLILVQLLPARLLAEAPAETVASKPALIKVQTDDVELHCDYYKSAAGKKAVPIVLVHGWGGDRTQLAGLARFLQASGKHAVIVPDLRGHGESKTRKASPGVPAREIVADELSHFDMVKLMTRDFVYLKNELIEHNNAGEFNIDLLTLVGVEFGTLVAWNWAATDWSQPDVVMRAGRDVKAVALVSPTSAHRKPKATALPAIKLIAANANLSIMAIGGVNDHAAAREMKAIDNIFSKAKADYIRREKASDLQGLALLDDPTMKVQADLATFIALRIVARATAKELPAWDGNRAADPIPGD